MNAENDLRKISRAAGARQDEGIRQIKNGGHRSRHCARAWGAKKNRLAQISDIIVGGFVSSSS